MDVAAVRRPDIGQRFDVEADLTGLDVDRRRRPCRCHPDRQPAPPGPPTSAPSTSPSSPSRSRRCRSRGVLQRRSARRTTPSVFASRPLPSRLGRTTPVRTVRPGMASGLTSPANAPIKPQRLPSAALGWHPVRVRTVYEAAGGEDGLLRLADAWHARVLADEIVSHAFNPAATPTTPDGWPRTGPRRLGGRRSIRARMATRPPSCGCAAATDRIEEIDQRANSLLRSSPSGQWPRVGRGSPAGVA